MLWLWFECKPRLRRSFSLAHPYIASRQIHHQAVQNLDPFRKKQRLWVGMPRLFQLSQKPSKAQCYKVRCVWKPKPGYGAPTHTRNDVLLCSHVRLIDLRGSERHPTPQMFKQACFTCCQKAGLCRQRVLRGWCSWAAAGLRLHFHQALPAELFSSCASLPQQWLTSGLGYQAVIPSLLAKSSVSGWAWEGAGSFPITAW